MAVNSERQMIHPFIPFRNPQPSRGLRAQFSFFHDNCQLMTRLISDGEQSKHARLLLAKAQCPDSNADELHRIGGESLAELTLDSPTMDFYADLSDLYPDGVVLLSVHESDEQWWRSWVDTLGVYYCNWQGLFLRALIWPVWSLADSVWMTSSFISGWRE